MKQSSLSLALAAGFSLLLTACEKETTPTASAARPPVEVSVVTMEPRPVEIETVLPGRLQAVRKAEIRARVAGVLDSQLYTEGTVVESGDSLFQIDPAPLQATYDSAAANLASAEANLAQTQARAERYAQLIESKAISAQDFDDAQLGAQAAEARVLAAKAALETARLNLEYTQVLAPIKGRAGKPEVTEGALVGYNTPTLLTTIHQLDPIYFDFSQASAQWLQFRRSFESGTFEQVGPTEAMASLRLEDGTLYEHAGRILFTDASVNPTTGMISLRAEFPNPEHLLLPGMFARIELPQARDTAAITAPQRAVMRGPNGTATVFVINAENVVETRSIELDRAIGDAWIVRKGLSAGDRIVVEGLQKVRPGATVTTVPFATAQPPAEELALNR